MVKPLFVYGVLMLFVTYSTFVDKRGRDQPSQSVQIAQAKALKQQLALEREQQARREALRVKRETVERVRLARLEREREQAFEKAFDESYIAPEGVITGGRIGIRLSVLIVGWGLRGGTRAIL